MTKIPLIIGAGHGWCATTPLHLTLQCANKCAHGGLLKEDHLLSHIYDPTIWEWREPWYKKLQASEYCPVRDRLRGYLGKYGYHYEKEEIEEYYSRTPTLKTYIMYYTRHYDRIKHEYKYVSDFSNSTANLPRSFIAKIAPVLKKHFDIKVLKIFRDPTRRLYSELSQRYQDSEELRNTYGTSKEYWRSYLKKGYITPNSDYIGSFKSFNEHFSTISIISEELWGGKNNAQENLEKFLDFKIEKLWPNAYFPEMGTKAPHYEAVKDQWSSDLEDLTEEDLEFGRKYLAKYYDEWYNYFGTMPWR